MTKRPPPTSARSSSTPTGRARSSGLALLHAREQRYPQALDAYEQARRLGADQVVELCALYHETGKLSRAMGCLQDVLARDPENPRGRTLMEQVQRTAASRRPA